MSLLLDALKKSGHGQNATANENGQADTTPGLTLEELPPQRREPSAQTASSFSSSEPARDAGKSLFAAKKSAPAKRRKMKLGIVPIALIGGTLIGSGYGYYVWREIQPRPVARAVARPAPPPAAPTPPQQNTALSAAPPLQPLQAAPPSAETIQPQAVEKPPVTVRHRTPRRHAPRKQTFTIEKDVQVDSITPLLNAGYRAYRSGDYAMAQQNYSRVLQQDDKNRDALLGMAAIAQQQGNDAIAAQYYGQVLALDPRDPQAQAGMAALEKGGNPADKESRLKLLLEQQPQSAALQSALGNLYAEQARWSEAQQAYFTAYSLQPDAAQYAYNLAISLDHLGQSKLAAQYYQRALQLDRSANPSIDHAQVQQRLYDLQAH